MKTVLKIVVVLVGTVLLIGAGTLLWASTVTSRGLAHTHDSHIVDFPIPIPLTADEIAELGIAPDEAAGIALERALERGRHLVEARYACGECHGENFGGGTMVDAFPIGSMLGPNLTSGRGSVTAEYTPADWDRIVRHGIRRDGRGAVMPSEDFLRMSDQELSDIVAYIRSVDPVDNEVPASKLGPLGKILFATGQLHLSVNLIPDHDSPHALFPPPAEVNIAFGEHLAAVCVGCHGIDLRGGRIAGGDPSWPPAANLTPHAEGLGGWSYDDFVTAMRDSRRPDGTELRVPMTFTAPFAQRKTDIEMEAIWTYLQSLEPQPGR